MSRASFLLLSFSWIYKSKLLPKLSILALILGSLPPERNYYSWATEIIYDVARLVHLDVDAIDEQSNAAVRSKKPDSKYVHSLVFTLGRVPLSNFWILL
jgi:hypothetical protein